MNKHAPLNSEQGTERIEQLLRRAMPPVGEAVEAPRDLWPAMQQRMRRKQKLHEQTLHAVPWFDWALAAGLVAAVAAFPAAVPVLLYYL